ncbi:MAG TPA: hypothetical protein VFU97_09415 [Xanthobacteraceae bacterium]|jgi:hypothetical protein|nr:hypothetical protein [Xanthobacteraceae bacterium]
MRETVRFVDKMESLVSRVQLWFSTHKRIDGLWISTWERDPDFLLRRVEEALELIKTYDRLRYDRITRDLDRVWARMVFGYAAQYTPAMNACELDVRFVLAVASSPAIIAASIVHEATHARIMHRGIEYAEPIRARIEAICVRRELAFAKKLPNGLELQELAEGRLERCATPEFWTNAKFRERDVEGTIEAARDAGIPMWIVRVVFAVARLGAASRRKLRRLPGA